MDDHSVFHPLQFFEFEVIAWDYDNSSVIQQTQLRRDSAYEYYYTFWSKGGYLFDVRIEEGEGLIPRDNVHAIW